MIGEIAITAIQGTGYFQKPVRQDLEHGEVSPEAEEQIFQEEIEEEREKVVPVYNSKGKLIEYDNSGRRLSIKA